MPADIFYFFLEGVIECSRRVLLWRKARQAKGMRRDGVADMQHYMAETGVHKEESLEGKENAYKEAL